jgi:glutamine synthetase
MLNQLRNDVDKLETLVDKEFWPLPTYAEMLFGVD